MKARGLLRKLLFAFPVLFACSQKNDVAGGSSGVVNPDILVAFTNISGKTLALTGTVSIYAADQNPALDPDPVIQIRMNGDSSIKLSRLDFGRGDSGEADSYNILVMGDKSLGGLFQNLSYNPATRKFSTADSQGVIKVQLRMVNLVRYEASLDLASKNSLERVFIPGTPFQSVVVDSNFTFDSIPRGIFPVRMIRKYSEEIRLPESLNTDDKKRFHVDTSVVPIPRPPPSPPPTLTVNAGGDQTVSLTAENFLSGQISGVSNEDPRLALLWRQISPDPQSIRVIIENSGLTKTKVVYPQTGTYRFVLLASFGMDLHMEDTLSMDVKPIAFLQPIFGDTLRLNNTFNVVWSDDKSQSLSLQYSVNGGSNWSFIATTFSSQAGLNSFTWIPADAPSGNCFMRLLDNSKIEVARSGRFVLRTP